MGLSATGEVSRDFDSLNKNDGPNNAIYANDVYFGFFPNAVSIELVNQSLLSGAESGAFYL